MAGTGPEASFHFVDWSDLTGPNKNPATRVFIRKQAMSKAAAARKKRGNWGKTNIGQSVITLPTAQQSLRQVSRPVPSSDRDNGLVTPPGSVSSSDGSDLDTGDLHVNRGPKHGEEAATPEHAMVRVTAIPPKMSCTGYETLRMQSNFDILDLSALTTFHVGRITTETLYESPLLLVDVLQCRQWSYFTYIPSRYGHFICLDDAARCVAQRVRRWMQGEVNASAAVLSLYTKALKSLQAAINDPVLCQKAETLCATELMSIYELLDNASSPGWARHAAGAKSLLKLRGPQRFQTSFEKALFMAQVGPIYTESLIENFDCFLQDPDWQAVLQSVVLEHPVTISPFTDHGTVVVSLWSILFYLPSLFKDVQAIVCSSDYPSPSDLRDAQIRVADLETKIVQWRSTHEPLLRPTFTPSSTDAKAEKRFETLGMCLTCLMIVKRLAIALDPLIQVAPKKETDAEDLANDIITLELTAIANNPRAGLFMRFKKEAARATLLSKHEWRVTSLVDARVGVNGLIAKWVFEHWCILKGRRI